MASLNCFVLPLLAALLLAADAVVIDLNDDNFDQVKANSILYFYVRGRKCPQD